MITALSNSVLELVARGERGVPGTPGDYDYETTGAAAAQNIPVIRHTLRVGGRYQIADQGNALWRRVATAPTHTAKFQSLDGGWWELSENRVDVRMFGCVGNPTIQTDDTSYFQDAIDYCITFNKFLHVPRGSYPVDPLWGNGRAWVLAGKPASGQQAGVRGLIGEGGAFLGSRLVARAGSAAYVAGSAVFTLRNAAQQVISGVYIDGSDLADTLIDAAWLGGGLSTSDPTAPACNNTFENLIGQNAKAKGFNFDQAADCLVQNVTYRDAGNKATVAMSLKLPGGGIWANNLHFYNGRLELSAQNSRVSDSALLGGVQIVGAGISMIELDNCQIATDPTTGYAVYSNTTAGSFGTSALLMRGGFMLASGAHIAFFAGRWATGAKVDGTHFNAEGYFHSTNWTPIAGAASLPVFDFQHCRFFGTSNALPASIPLKVIVTGVNNVLSSGTINSRRDFPFGRLGSSGLFGTDQVQGIVPTNVGFGLAFNRTGISEVEWVGKTDLFRVTKTDGTTHTALFNINNSVGTKAVYPAVDNDLDLGRAATRWKTVYAVTGAINTSDARLKSPVRPMSAAEIAVARDLAPELGLFQWRDAIEEKGADRARFHAGMTVQRAMEIFDRHGLDPFRYSFICYDRWDEAVIDVAPIYDQTLIPAVIDQESGQEIEPARTVDNTEIVLQPGFQEILEAGDVFSFRETGLLMFVVAGLHQGRGRVRAAAVRHRASPAVTVRRPVAFGR